MKQNTALETSLMMEATILFDKLLNLFWNTEQLENESKVFRIMGDAKRRKVRRIKNFIVQINKQLDDEILDAEFDEILDAEFIE